jgi:hypothetical protein
VNDAPPAGGSAQAEYDRRAARHAEELRQRRPRILAFGAIVAVVGLVVVAVVSPLYGLAILLFDAVLVMSAFVTPNSIMAWQTGAAGEVRTGRLLEPLTAEGFRILHDRKIPGARSANIDHIVIGPPGVFVVETKSYQGSLQIRGDEIFVAGRRKNGWIDEVNREAAAVQTALATELAALGLTVRPVICVHRADLPWFKSEVRGVRVVGGKDLVSRLRKASPVMSPADVERLAALADARLHRATVASPPLPSRE